MRPRSRLWPADLKILLVAAALVAAGFVLDAAGPGVARAADPAIHARARRPPAPSHEIYGYLPYWQLDAGTVRRLDYDRLSTIAFFAVPIRVDGALDRGATGYRAYVSRAARTVTNAAHARGVRVVPTFQLFDSGSRSTLRRFLAHPRSQARFIGQALALMARRGADGANLDVEPLPEALAPQFAAFVTRFSRQMHRRFPGSQLTVATPAIVSDRLLKGLQPVVDRFFVMTYDYHRPASRLPGAVAPLTGGPHNVSKTIANYLRLVPARKLILGVPFYGYSWPVVRTGASWRVRPNPGRWGGVRAVTYASALDWLSRHRLVKVHHEGATGSWFRYVDRANWTVREVHFEDAASAAAKFNYAIALGLSGVGVWSLGYDAGQAGMARAIQATFVHPVRRITARATVRPVRLVRGRVRLEASVVVHDLGTRAERGTITWRIVGPRGHTIESGRRLGVVYPGGHLDQRIAVTLGRPSSLRSGTYRIIVRFVAGPRTSALSAVRFHQPF